MTRNSLVFTFSMGVLLAALAQQAGADTPVGTAFTYQGQLKQNGSPGNGTFNMAFTLWNDLTASAAANQIGSTLIFDGGAGHGPAVSVSGGVFTVALDFGAGPFMANQARWLEITVAGTTLSPRQPLTPTPFALDTRGLTVDLNGNVLVNQSFTVDLNAANNGGAGNALRFGASGTGEAIGSKRTSGGNQYGLDFYTAGANRMSISNGGNVGIGAASVGQRLLVDIGGATAQASLKCEHHGSNFIVRPAAAGGNSTVIENTGGGALALNPGGSPVGIGTTTPAAALHVSSGATAGTFFRLDNPANSNNLWSVYVDGTDANDFSLHIRDEFASANRLTIDSGGYVGIGTTNPKGLLHVEGDYYGKGHLWLHAYEGDGQSGTAFVQARDDSATSAIGMQLRTKNGSSLTDVMRLTPDGKVGIGTSSPGSRLDVRTSSGDAIYGETADGNNDGLHGFCSGADGTGLLGECNNGGYAYGVWGKSNSGEAGHFDGRVRATIPISDDCIYGHTTATSGNGVGVSGESDSGPGWGLFAYGDSGASGFKYFHIDHPLDPANKYLNHISAEGPEPLDIYSGSIVSDDAGIAWVDLPGYFEALNRDFRFQLTVADPGDDFVQAKVWRKVQNNRFAIRTSKPHVEVFWQVTGIRNDPAAQRSLSAKPVEQDKIGDERGKYLTPELYGAPAELSLGRRPSAAKSSASKPTSN